MDRWHACKFSPQDIREAGWEAENARWSWFPHTPLFFSKRFQVNKYMRNRKDIVKGQRNKLQTVGRTNCWEESCFLLCLLFLVPRGKHEWIWSKKARGQMGQADGWPGGRCSQEGSPRGMLPRFMAVVPVMTQRQGGGLWVSISKILTLITRWDKPGHP